MKPFAPLLLSALLCLAPGCAAWNKSWLTPDSFNYTTAVNHDPFAVDQHWFGFSWNLKHERHQTP